MPETLPEAAAAVAATQSNAERVDSWVKDGTPAVEPVTTETPPAGEQPRDERGRFAEAGSEPPSATHAEPPGSAPASVSAPAPGASAQEVQEFIEAQLADGSAFKVPKGLKLPSRRGDETVYEPLETVLGERMMERDYRIKTHELGGQRRQVEQERAQIAAEKARVQAREQFVKEQEQSFIEAQKDPEKWEAFQAHMDQLRTNPIYRKHFEDAQAKRETDAELAVYRGREEQSVVHEGVADAVEWIAQIAQEPDFIGVDPERVRVRYGELLVAGRARLDPAEVRQLFRAEADYLHRSVSPVQSKLAALEAEIQALKSGKAAESHNATTAHAVGRAKAPPVTKGTPPAPAAPSPKGQFGPRDLADRNAEWARQR